MLQLHQISPLSIFLLRSLLNISTLNVSLLVTQIHCVISIILEKVSFQYIVFKYDPTTNVHAVYRIEYGTDLHCYLQ